MTKEEETQLHKEWTRQLIEVMQAYIDGKEIECREETGNKYDVRPYKPDALPIWDWGNADYRIKGEE